MALIQGRHCHMSCTMGAFHVGLLCTLSELRGTSGPTEPLR